MSIPKVFGGISEKLVPEASRAYFSLLSSIRPSVCFPSRNPEWELEETWIGRKHFPRA